MRWLKFSGLTLISALWLLCSQNVGGQQSPTLSWFCQVNLGGAIESSPAMGDWPMFRHDLRHTGSINSGFGTIYIGSNDLHLYAIDSQTCAINWRYRTGAAVKSSPAILPDESGGAVSKIYVGSDDGKLYTINPDGTLSMQFTPPIDSGTLESPGAIRSSPTILQQSTDRVIFGSDDRRLFVVQSGLELARYPQEGSGVEVGSFRASIMMNSSKTKAYANSLNRVLYSLLVEGSAVSLDWDFKIDAPSSSTPAIGTDETIYLVSGIGTLYSIRSDGIEQWRLRLNGDVSSSPAISANGTVYVTTENGYLHGIRPNGTFACTFQSYGPDGRANSGDESLGGIRSSPAISDRGYVIFGSNDGILYVIEEETCKYKASYATRGPILSSPLLASDGNRTRVIFGSGDGNLYVLNLNF